MYTKSADLIFLNGVVISMEVADNKASAVAITSGKIVYVGTDKEAKSLAGPETEIIDLKGRTLLPGFIESHMHPMMLAHDLLGVECGGENTKSISKMIKVLEDKVKITPKGEWIFGAHWDDSRFEENRNPTRWDIDKVSPDHPVVLMRTCVHVVLANSLALKLSNIDKNTPDPEGGHIQKDPDTGEPTGILQERAMELLPDIPYTFDQLKNGMKLALKILAENGVTTIGDMAGQPDGLRIYQQLKKENSLTVRVRMWAIGKKTIIGNGMLDDLYAIGMESGFGNDMISIQGVKYVLDGSVSGKTAAITEPYYLDPTAHGIIYCDDEREMIESVHKAFQGGLRVSIHAIGDRAIDFALNVIEKAGAGQDIAIMRNRIEHCILPRQDQFARIKKLGLIVGSSFGFIYSLGEGYLNALGLERVKTAIPQKTYQELGIIAPGNTDCPVCEVNPFWAIYGAVTRKTFRGNSLGEEQRVDTMEALKTYSTYAAYSTFDEDKIGSIKEGKLADMIVLDKNILLTDPEEIKDMKVLMTVVDGKIVWRNDTI